MHIYDRNHLNLNNDDSYADHGDDYDHYYYQHLDFGVNAL